MAARSRFRSGMEARIVPSLLLIGGEYEPIRLVYTPSQRAYIPDVVLPNGIAIEIKGWFTAADRTKMLLVKTQYPDLDVRMVLASPKQKLNKTSKTSQAEWCMKHNIPFAQNGVPDEWISRPTNFRSLAILNAATRIRHTK